MLQVWASGKGWRVRWGGRAGGKWLALLLDSRLRGDDRTGGVAVMGEGDVVGGLRRVRKRGFGGACGGSGGAAVAGKSKGGSQTN